MPLSSLPASACLEENELKTKAMMATSPTVSKKLLPIRSAMVIPPFLEFLKKGQDWN